jgi:glutathione-regulated potassium-efflux system ancillary protein KefC
MTNLQAVAAMWFALALIASLLSIRFRLSSALIEIMIGMGAQLIIGVTIGTDMLGSNANWVKFLSSTGAILLVFLAGAELDPSIFKLKWKEAATVGFASFIVPFLASAAAAYYVLDWGMMASWLAGLGMSTTSAGIVYAVTLEFGLNKIEFGKTILVACFVTDMLTVIMLGLIFAPFTIRTLIALGISAAVFIALPWLTPRVFKRYGDRLAEIETKFLLFCLLGMAALAEWADSEAVLPAYLVGMALAGTVGKDHALIRRLRTLTFGLLTPFFFILAGSIVSIPALIAAPAASALFLIVKVVTKFIGVFPVAKRFGSSNKEAIYTSLLMSTGLTFGTIASLFGRSHGIIDASQYSTLAAAIIGTAIIPTIVADRFYLPRHLLPPPEPPEILPSRKSRVLGKVLHANDGSEWAFRALGLALAIAKQNDSELHMVSIEEIGHLPEFTEEVREEIGTASRRFRSVIHRARTMAEESEVNLITHVMAAGHPVRSIVDLAAELDVELLVIGEKPHPTLYERFAGSRADRIMKLAPCPVLVVK